MPSVKTAISVDKPLFDEAEKLAEELRVSRSRLVALALEMFIAKHRSQQMREQLDRVYEEAPPTAEERQALGAMRRQQRRLLEGEG